MSSGYPEFWHCKHCNQTGLGKHFCPALHKTSAGAQVPAPLTIEDIRRIVREELSRVGLKEQP